MEAKGLSWIGNACEKFEAMCMEMEEAMYEDAVKYVENQVQTVGATVKKFYADVMQDMHPKSDIDPVKVAAADLPLNPYAHSEMNLKANAKKDGREIDWKSIDDSEVISGKTNTGVYRRPSASKRGNSKDDLDPVLPSPVAPISGTNNHLSSFSKWKSSREVASDHVDAHFPSAHFEGGSRNTNEKISKSFFIPVLPKSYASVNSPANATIRPAVSTEQNQANSATTKVDSPATAATIRSASSTGLKQADSAASSIDSSDIGSVVTTGQKQAESASTSSGSLSAQSSDAELCVKNGVDSPDIGSATTEQKQADSGSTFYDADICVKNLVGSQSGGAIWNVTFDENFFGEDVITAHQERFDGSGINAAKNDNAVDSEGEIVEPLNESILEETCVMVEGVKLHAAPRGKGRRKSYKKKLREAFSSKKRLTKKEYEQLAAKYIEEESDEAIAERVSPVRPEGSRKEIGSACSSESEWELL